MDHRTYVCLVGKCPPTERPVRTRSATLLCYGSCGGGYFFGDGRRFRLVICRWCSHSISCSPLQERPKRANVRETLYGEHIVDQALAFRSAEEWCHQVLALGDDLVPRHRIVHRAAHRLHALG